MVGIEFYSRIGSPTAPGHLQRAPIRPQQGGRKCSGSSGARTPQTAWTRLSYPGRMTLTEMLNLTELVKVTNLN